MAKAAPKRRAANGYKLAEPLPKGEILQDIAKKKWKLGPSIGQGGFGEIYSAQDANSSGAKYPYVIKIEPHTNGPLFVEMHFYMRNAKPSDVEDFKKERGLKTFGMPLYLGSGSHDYKGEKYRFIVMEKFGTDLWKLFLENDRSFPTSTVFKLAMQILDILEYIHLRGYVHADIKGANILMGTTKETINKQVYLVDFGLATKSTTEEEFKPNPKKAHDGTIEYLSRDAHKGVQTKRGDLEILAYNITQWLGCTLPWEKNLKDPNSVHKCKEEYMDSVPKLIKSCFGNKTPPGALVDYLNYIKTLKFDDNPDYNKIRKIFTSGIKDAGGSLKSPLEFSSKKTPKRKSNQKLASTPKRKIGRKVIVESSEDEKENMEDDDLPIKVKPDTMKQESDSDEDIIDGTSSEDEPILKKTVTKNVRNKKKVLNPPKRSHTKTIRKHVNSSVDEKENLRNDDISGEKQTTKKDELDSNDDIESGNSEDEPSLKKTVTQNPRDKKNSFEVVQNPPNKRGRARNKRTIEESSEDEKENVLGDDVSKVKHTAKKQATDSDEDIANRSEDEPTMKKTVTRNKKDKRNDEVILTPSKTRGRPKKNYKEDSDDEEIETQRNKVRPRKKKNNAKEKIEEIDPYEGYTAAMREVMMKKIQNGKSKAQKKHKPTIDQNMPGYNDGMKEVMLKKQERITSKRGGKKTDLVSAAPSTSKESESDSS